MQIQWLRKYLLTCLIIFMMCPKRSLTKNDAEPDFSADVEHKTKKLQMTLSEPGFNYTDQEMVKLKIWPRGIIPYYIDDFSFDMTLREKLRSILSSYNSLTGIDFLELSRVPDDETKRWVLFINRRGVLDCEEYSINSFAIKGVQRVVLGYDCFGADGGELASTVLAIAGVPAQHNAPNRDDHITVVMDNIIPEKRQLFKVLQNNEWLFHHVPYDFLSAGHYSFHKYTINGSATIIPKSKVNLNIAVGEGNGISPEDIWKMKMMYNFISKIRKKPKVSDCSKIFKPGSKFSEYKPLRDDIIIPRVKPAKYLGLPDENTEDFTNDFSGDESKKLKKKYKIKKDSTTTTNSTEDPLTKNATNTENELIDDLKKDALQGAFGVFIRTTKKGRDKLDHLPDFDTDKDGGRVKLLEKIKSYKKRTALQSRLHLSKLASLSDYDTDKNNK